MDLALTSRAVIVCASSSGLGKATALEFAREGARVMLAARREDQLRAACEDIGAVTGNTPAYTVTDITRAEDIARLVSETVRVYGGVYTLINNGGGPPAGAFDQFDDAAWQSAFELNLLSYVRLTRAVLPYMRASGEGRIVSFTSSSVRSPIDNLILSNTFRMGVLGVMKTLAAELGPQGILVNVLGPGRVQTERLTQLDTLRAQKLGAPLEEVRKQLARTIPLGRYGEPEEMARLAVFLGSPANSYVSGQTILIDGAMVRTY